MRRRAMVLATASMLAVAAGAGPANAQSIASRVNAVRDGTVQMLFAPGPGVCGDGRGSVWVQDRRGVYMSGNHACIVGPVRVLLDRSEGRTVRVRKCVACRPYTSVDVDMGEVPAPEAARFLIAFARQAGARNADEALSAAAFADAGDLSADFSAVVHDENAPLEARRQALFWFGQSDAPTDALIRLYDDLRPQTLREHYSFVLSQRREDDAAITKLIDMARHDQNGQVRKQAMFWLGQSKDPRAIKFFKDIILSP